MCGIEDSLKFSCTEIPRDLLEGKKTNFWKDICNFAKGGFFSERADAETLAETIV